MQRIKLQEGISVEELAQRISGQVVCGSSVRVSGICPLNDPRPDCLSFVRRENPALLLEALRESKVSALLVADDAALPENLGETAIVKVKDPLGSLVELVPLFYSSQPTYQGISSHAVIDEDAVIGEEVSIGPFCAIGPRAVIGDKVTLHPNVTIYPGARIGAGSVIHSGAVIREECVLGPETIIQNGAVVGADGFGYLTNDADGIRAIPQVGTAELAAGVEVGANSCIDRATLGRTTLDTNCKLDNLVQVGHNVQIGQNSLLCGQVGIAGSAKLGKNVILAGQTGVMGHISVGDNVRVAARSGVHKSIEGGQDYAGYPITTAREWRRNLAALSYFFKNFKRLKRLLKG